ncbi:MAG TPA: 5-deoxyglucuronate isomerase [Clostridiales bacterium]|nr:5-deoxyglucuronate isomerase [Clostridiales bacterium]
MSQYLIKGQSLDRSENCYFPISEIAGDHRGTGMDFGLLRLCQDQEFQEAPDFERAYLLIFGEVTLEWAGRRVRISRGNCFDDSPWVLQVPGGMPVRITGAGAVSELSVHRVRNDRPFATRLYTPGETADEYRGAGTLGETATRIVRTVFDFTTAPWSNLVLGEVIGFPGKWSSYPPHSHPQPEIYHYRTCPRSGFAYCDLGEEVLKVQDRDTVFITDGCIHPHVTAPGYALWYLWVIRHLDGNPYIAPDFVSEHQWVTAQTARFWPERKGGD